MFTRKFYAFVLFVVLVVALTGCGGDYRSNIPDHSQGQWISIDTRPVASPLDDPYLKKQFSCKKCNKFGDGLGFERTPLNW